MNLPQNYTMNKDKLQEAFQHWDKKIASHLPENIEEILDNSGTIIRKRGIKNALSFLQVLFIFAASGLSFRMLSLCSKVLFTAGISDTAWRRHLKKSIPFLHSVSREMLSSLHLNKEKNDGKRPLYAVDASTVRQEGKEQRQARIHMCYDLAGNHISQVKITDVHTAEGFSNFDLEDKGIYLADAGYGTARNYAYICGKNADVVMRVSPNHFNLYESDGSKINLHFILKEMQKTKTRETLEVDGYSFFEGKPHYTRIIIKPLSEEKAKEERRKKQRQSQKNGHKTKDETLTSAGFIIIATSLGKEYDPEEILFLYKTRWQVELLFKRIKQNFKIQSIRKAGENYLPAIIYCWIIIWIIMERQIILAEKSWAEKQEKEKEITLWHLTEIFYKQIVGTITLFWVLAIDLENIDLLNHCLSSRLGKRKNQDKELHSGVLDSLIS